MISADLSSHRARLIVRARRLAWFSVGWMAIEGLAGVLAGVLAGSVALTGFGLDSAIEAAASLLVIWRFTGGRVASERSERRAHRGIAVCFFALAVYLAIDAISVLASASRPHGSWLGTTVAIVSLMVMPLLARAKQGLASELGSSALAAEGAQNMICAYLAGAVLAGLLANTLFGLWWLDPIIALAIAALAVREGSEAWNGDAT